MPTKEQIQSIFNRIDYHPTPAQAAIHDCNNQIRLVAGGERAGKLLAIDTPIPTTKGWRKIADIKVGDYVFADDGKPTKTIGVSEIYTDEPCYVITFDTGEQIVAGENHQWAVQSEHQRKNTNRKKVNGKELWVAPPKRITNRKHSVLITKELSAGTLIKKPQAKWGNGVSANYSIPCTMPIEYESIGLPIAPYVLGAWLGDGSKQGGTITSADDEITKHISSFGYTVTKHKSKYGWGIIGLQTSLRRLGLLNNKHVPFMYLYSSVEDRLELLRGLMDTDGYSDGKGCCFFNKSPILIEAVQELLASLGIKSWLRTKEARLYGKPCGLAHTVTFSTPLRVFNLSRKLEKCNPNPTNHTQNHYIRSVEPCAPVPVKCLEVDSEKHLYLIGKSFIPTHNSKLSANDLTAQMFFGKLYWLVAADYERTKAEYNYICENLDRLKIEYNATKHVDPGQIDVEGDITIVTKSAKDPRRLAYEAPDGILGCEASQLDYETYLRLRGRLLEKRGWLLLSGTFESSLGWYVEAFERGKAQNSEDMVSFSLPTWSNIHIFPQGRDDPQIKKLEDSMPREWFMERFGGVPTPPRGLVFNDFRTHIHVGDYKFDPTELCYLFVDPGYASAYSVLVAQKNGDDLNIVDEIYEKGLITSDIIKICKQKPWWNRVVGGAIDIAATQHQAMAAPTEVWLREAGISLRHRKIRIQDGIEAVKRMLVVSPKTNSALLHIDSGIRGLISEFGGCPNPLNGQTMVYQWRVDNSGNVIGDTPDDKNNHSSKALAYGIVDLYGYSAFKPKITKIQFV